MTISTEPVPLSYDGDDVTVAFPVTWNYFAKSHVVATLRSSAGAETLWVLDTDYTLTDADQGSGTLTATTAPATGETLIIDIDPPNTQEKSLPIGGAVPTPQIEDGLDLSAQRDAKLDALINRTMRVPTSDLITGSDLDLPIDSDRALKYLGYDANGKPVMLSGTDTPAFASNITYTPGGTGAVSTDVESKLRERVSILDFMTSSEKAGIVSGTVDVTAAIVAALAAANVGGGEVYAPAGTYLCGDIDWPGNNIKLIGASSGWGYDSSLAPKTIFKAKAGTTVMFDLVQTGTAQDRAGNVLQDIDIDGNAIAARGIDQAFGNVFTRVRIRGCTEAGMHLANWTNSPEMNQCQFYLNTGVGLKVSGSSSTTFTLNECRMMQNTLGGILLEGGFGGKFNNCIVESNTGYGVKLDKVTGHTGSMGAFEFNTCWFEDNAATAGTYVVEFDAFNNNANYAVMNSLFNRCRFTIGTGREFADLSRCKFVSFDNCNYSYVLPRSASQIVSTVETRFVSFTNHSYLDGQSGFGPNGFSMQDLDDFLSTAGPGCFHSDRDRKTYVGGFAITAATQANPVVITVTDNPFRQGEEIDISGVVGMTELNGNTYICGIISGSTVQLLDSSGSNVDGTGYTAYTSGGEAALENSPAFLNSWVNRGSTWKPAQYWFNEGGEVNLAGSVSTGSGVPTVIFTLPVGYRPTETLIFTVSSNGAFGECEINTSGSVTATVGSTTSFSLDGIRFSTAMSSR
jgi:hypothetical protein